MTTHRAARGPGVLHRRAFLGGVSALAASAAAAPAFAATPGTKRGGTMRMGKGHGQTTDTLDPATYDNGFMIAMAFACHGQLTEVAADGSLQPHLADSWEASADAAKWTFKLRKGVEFHSGRALMAEDVIASLNHHRGEGAKSGAAPIVKPIREIRADGPLSVVIELENGYADFPFVLSDYHLCIGPSAGGKVDWTSGDGCGPYRIDRFEPGVKAALTRHEGHWRGGNFDAIEMLALLDPAARTSALIQRKVDAIDRVDLDTVDRLRRSPFVDVHSVAGTQHYTFAMACNRAPFNDVNVRLALKHAINREELVDKILRGYGVIGNDHPIGRRQRYYNAELPQTPYDPEKARWYLTRAGVDRLSVSLSAADAAFTGAVDAAVLYKKAASSAMITIDVVREANDGYWSNVWMKKPFCAVYWGGRPIEDQMFSIAYQGGAAWNDSFWANDRFDKLLLAARAELDEAKRRAMYYEMQAIVNQDGGVIVPMFASYVFATARTVGTPEVLASNWDLDGERWSERWWFA